MLGALLLAVAIGKARFVLAVVGCSARAAKFGSPKKTTSVPSAVFGMKAKQIGIPTGTPTPTCTALPLAYQI